MLLTILCLTFIVFWLTNLSPNLERLAKTQANNRMTDEQVVTWLDARGYNRNVFVKYGEWMGIVPGWTNEINGVPSGRCIRPGVDAAPEYCGVLQGDFGFSTVSQEGVSEVIGRRLSLTGWLMLCTFLLMVPMALVVGIAAGMREGSRLDRGLSTFSIATTATPEYVSGVIFIAIFTSSAVGLKWFKGTATSAADEITFANFTLPVGVSFKNVVLKHALRNALIAPFTVIMLQFPFLLTGVVIVESLFNYKDARSSR